jgi:hypothetical protein
MRMPFYLTSILILFLSSTCDDNQPCNRTIWIENNSQDTVVYAKKAYEGGTELAQCYLAGVTLMPNEGTTETLKICWEEALSGNSTFEFYIVSKEGLNEDNIFYDCDSVNEKNEVLKYYNLSLEQVQGSNWTITYP